MILFNIVALPFKLIYWIGCLVSSPIVTYNKFRLWLKYRVARSNVRSRPSHYKLVAPKKLSVSQQMAVDTAIQLIHESTSELLYGAESGECYIKNDTITDGIIYVFIERRNIKIINTIFGYDIDIDDDTEIYLKNLFKRKQQRLRNRFKKEALNKVQYSLNNVLHKLKK